MAVTYLPFSFDEFFRVVSDFVCVMNFFGVFGVFFLVGEGDRNKMNFL